eukprot:3797253-Rhodomonas_salina.1
MVVEQAARDCFCGSASAFGVWLVTTASDVLEMIEGESDRTIRLRHDTKQECSEGCSTSNAVAYAPQGLGALHKSARRHAQLKSWCPGVGL